MQNESQYRILLLMQYLLDHTDEEHYVSVSDILRLWESKGIQVGRKSAYHDIQLLTDCGLDIICVKSTQNRYFIGSRLFELPELKLLVDAVKSSHFTTEKKSATLIEKLGRLISVYNAQHLNVPAFLDGMIKPGNESIYYVSGDFLNCSN